MIELTILLFCVPIVIWMCLLERSLERYQEGSIMIIDEIKYLKRKVAYLEKELDKRKANDKLF